MGDGVDLMFPQGDLRVHAHKIDVAPIVLTGPQAVEFYVVELRQPSPSGRVFPYPILKRLLDKRLLALGDSGFIFVQDGSSLPVPLVHIVKNADIPEVQGVLDDLVGVDAPGSIGAVGLDVYPVNAFALHVPGPGIFGVVEVDFLPAMNGRVQQLKDKLPHHIRGEPGRAKPDGNLAGGQVFRLHLFQRLHVDLKRRV